MPPLMKTSSEQPNEASSFISMGNNLAEAVLSHSRTTPAKLLAMLEDFSDHPRGYAAQALMMVLSGRPEALPGAAAGAQKAVALAKAGHFPGFEIHFADAAISATSGDWLGAVEQLEKALILAPEETLAFKISHGLRFMLGDKRGLLVSAREQLDRLGEDHPHRGYVMGCLAFALEENGFYSEAERVGVEGVQLSPTDVWGLHAVSHVHEMQGRIGEGIAWIAQHEVRAREANNFGFHLFWHLALFLIEQGDIPSVFALYDREIRAEKTDDFRDLANAASLLMRLQLMGIPVGNRWDELADIAQARLNASYLPFADLHGLIALYGAGRHDALRQSCRRLDTINPASPIKKDGRIGNLSRAYIAGFDALGTGRADEAFKWFMPHIGRDAVLGGSDAQRDIFTQIALDAGIRGGKAASVQSHLNDRLMRRGGENRFVGSQIAKLGQRQILSPAMAPILSAMDSRHALAVLGV